MSSPTVTVKRDESGEDAMVRIRLKVPGSRFGAVIVSLYEYEAESLASDILELIR